VAAHAWVRRHPWLSIRVGVGLALALVGVHLDLRPLLSNPFTLLLGGALLIV
jgi:Na+-transporting methylmalonyl-CoA/oxaloacetate decarboxylase beta subunit